jgi:hypothetical protein
MYPTFAARRNTKIALVLPIVVGRVVERDRRGWHLAAGVLMVTALYLTQGRGPLIAAAVGIGVFAAAMNGSKRLVVFAGIVVAGGSALGWPGLLLFLWLLGVVFIETRLLRSGWLRSALMGSQAAMLVASLTVSTFTWAQILLIFWTLVGVTLALRSEEIAAVAQRGLG